MNNHFTTNEYHSMYFVFRERDMSDADQNLVEDEVRLGEHNSSLMQRLLKAMQTINLKPCRQWRINFPSDSYGTV